MTDRITREERERMKQVAEAASDGPWTIVHTFQGRAVRGTVFMRNGEYAVVAVVPDGSDAEHIVEFDPPTIKCLLAALDAAEARVEIAVQIVDEVEEGYEIANGSRLDHLILSFQGVTGGDE